MSLHLIWQEIIYLHDRSCQPYPVGPPPNVSPSDDTSARISVSKHVAVPQLAWSFESLDQTIQMLTIDPLHPYTLVSVDSQAPASPPPHPQTDYFCSTYKVTTIRWGWVEWVGAAPPSWHPSSTAMFLFYPPHYEAFEHSRRFVSVHSLLLKLCFLCHKIQLCLD